MDGNSCFTRLRVALLAGGDSAEREVSIASGQQVAQALSQAGHKPKLIDPAESNLAVLDWTTFDVCFVALHGGAGEDGRIQQQLEQWGVAYTGSGPAASCLAMSKSAAKSRFEQYGVSCLPSVVLSVAEIDAADHFPGARSEELLRKIAPLGFPVITKPEGQGSSLGVCMARTPKEVLRSLATSAQFDSSVLIEPLVCGREFTISLLGRDPLPMIEIVAARQLFTYEAKYSDPTTEYRLHSELRAEIEARLYRTAITATDALGTAGLSRVDIMLDQQEKPWVLEINTIPGMTQRSLSPRAAHAAGMEMSELVDWMIQDAISRHRTMNHWFESSFSRELS